MRILDGSVLPGDLVRVDIDPETDAMRFERVEQKAAGDSEAQSEAKTGAAETAASTAKSGRRR